MPPDSTPHQPAEGITPTEQYLGRLARRSFLRFWSYQGIFNDKDIERRREGKELCDLLIVFDNHVIIFSDKAVEFGDSGNPDVDWARWYRRAIKKSADQIWGAERWIRQFPGRLFLDRACTRPFPIPLPEPAAARVHRVVVAHDRSGRRRNLIGGSGSLVIRPDITGDEHAKSVADGGTPFAIGQIDPARGFVHVFDEVALDAVMGTLDTVSDFVAYLEKKEAFVVSGKLALAYGEEDLLAYYLKNVNDEGEHDFIVPPGVEQIALDEGHFADFLQRPEVHAKRVADAGSYLWDLIIDEVAGHALAGTLHFTSDPSLATQERLLRVLAREPRLRRRMMADAILEKQSRLQPDTFAVRVSGTATQGLPWYVLLFVPPSWGANWEEYREQRAAILRAYSMVVMLNEPDVGQVVGIATEPGLHTPGSSWDVSLLDREHWTDEQAEQARDFQERIGFYQNIDRQEGIEDEYPAIG